MPGNMMKHELTGNTAAVREHPAASAHVQADRAPGKPLIDGARSEEMKKLLGAVIMMVDDEALAIEVTRLHLEEVGFTRFVSTTDATRAMALLAETQPDLLLLDLMMPGLTGFQILELMEEKGMLKYVPTIILTAAGNPTTKLKALELGATEFLTKPVDPSELVLRVRNTLAAKAFWQGLGKRRAP
jgi:CheY-like chemotaxis protein